MIVKDLIAKLSEYNQNAEFGTIINNQFYKVEAKDISFGGSDGGTKLDATDVSIYLNNFNVSEHE